MTKIIVDTAKYKELAAKFRYVLFICKVKAGISAGFDLKAVLKNQCY